MNTEANTLQMALGLFRSKLLNFQKYHVSLKFQGAAESLASRLQHAIEQDRCQRPVARENFGCSTTKTCFS